MYPPGAPRQPEMDFDQLTARFRENLGKLNRRLGGGGVGIVGLALVVIVILGAVWLGLGFHQVGPGEQAARRLFGQVQISVTEPGLSWWWPSPIGSWDAEVVTQTRRMELGFISNEAGSLAPRRRSLDD